MTRHGLKGPPRGSRPQPPDELLPPSDQSLLLRGRYVLERVTDEDALVRISLARDVVLDRLLAVTVLQPQVAAHPHLVDRFLETERRTAALFHPNLITIFDVGESDGLCWSAHEYCGGGQLRQRLPTRQPIPGWQVISLLSQIGSALEALHRAGVVHGRLTPDCIRFEESGGAKLGGVGAAGVADLMGTGLDSADFDVDAYLAPEQRDQGYSGPQSDQYALALIGAELLAGSWHATGLGTGNDPAADLVGYLRKGRPDVPAGTLAALSRALSRDPGRRFASVDDFMLAMSGGVTSPARASAASGLLRPPTPEPTSTEAPPPLDLGRTRQSSPEERELKPVRSGLSGQAAHRISGARMRTGALARQASTVSLRGIGRLNAARKGVTARVATYRPPNPRTAVTWYRQRHMADRVLLTASAVALILAVALIAPFVLDPPKHVAAPALEGITADSARSLAADVGLNVNVREESSPSAPAGQVIRQEPPVGEHIRSDRPMRLVVSSGPPPVPVPNILRRDLDAARQELASIGLVLGTVYEYDTNRQAWGTITAQSVRSGREVTPGSAIDVTIATPPWTTVPRLLDRGIGDVENDLNGRGLKLGEVQLQTQSGVRAGTVLRQDPAPEAALRQGSRVGVVIAIPAPQE